MLPVPVKTPVCHIHGASPQKQLGIHYLVVIHAREGFLPAPNLQQGITPHHHPGRRRGIRLTVKKHGKKGVRVNKPVCLYPQLLQMISRIVRTRVPKQGRSICHGDFGICREKSAEEIDKIRIPHVIGIEKTEKFTGGVVHPQVARGACPPVLHIRMVQQLRCTGAFGDEIPRLFHGRIGRSVVDNDKLPIRVCLASNALQRLIEVR